MAAASSKSANKARDAFINALVSEVRNAAAARGVEVDFDTFSATVSSVDAKRCFFSLQIWERRWDSLVAESSGELEAVENKLKQEAVASVEDLMATADDLVSAASAASSHTDPGAHP